MRKNLIASFRVSLIALACVLSSTGASATIVDDLQPNTWLELPNTQLQPLNPCPGDNCNYSGPNQGFFGIMDAWSGGAFDTVQNRLLVWGGGHQSYYGNDMYGFDLDTLSWSQLMPPSPYEATLAHEAAGQYPDGRPVSRHTYNSLVFIESQNAFMATGAYAKSPSGASGDAKFWKLDFDNSNLQWSRAADGDSNGTILSGYSAYNRVTDTVYYHREGGGRLYKYDPGTNTHTFLTQKSVQQYATAAIDTSRNRMLVLGGGASSQAMEWDLNPSTPVYTNLLNVSAFTGSAGNELASSGQFGLDYDAQNDQYVAWKGGRTVYFINPVTFAVTKSTLGGDDPGAQSSNGTYGRFRYAPSVGGFVVVNATNQNVHVFKTSEAGFEPGPIVSFTVNDDSVQTGDSVTLSWTATNASSCVASGDWSGSFGTSGSQTISNLSSSQNFVITCSGDGGDTTQNINVTVTEPGPDPDPEDPSDWADRSTAPGVLTAYRFDSADEVNNWKQLDGSAGNVVWETGNKASGNGSLRINVLKTDGANSGSWRRWLSDDQREFTEGDEFYVSYRQYFPAYFSTHVFNGGGWKQSIISRNAAEMNGVNQDCQTNECGSNQLNEMVLVNYQYRGLVQGYNRNTGGAYPGWNVGSSNACSGSDFVYQNAVDRGPQNVGTACENDRARYGGFYSYGANTGVPDPLTGAFVYGQDNWVTFKIWVKLGSQGTGTNNSQVKVWAAHEGDDWDLLIDRNNLDLGAGPAHNTLWLLPYDTGKTANSSRDDTYTLYDEVIVSLNDIAAPGGSTPPPPPPVDPPSITFSANDTTIVPGATVSLTWSTTNANSCQASGDWSGARAVSGQQDISNVQDNASYTLTCVGSGGGTSRTVNVQVQAAVDVPTLEFNLSPLSLGINGTAVLLWNAEEAATCATSGSWSGPVNTAGFRVVGPVVVSETYTLTCTNSIGSVEDSVVISFEDSDSDGMPDVWETALFGSLANNGTNDSDSDGLTDQEEYTYGTDPGRDDTDGDSQTDGDEVAGGSDPRDPTSTSVASSPNQPVVADERKADLASYELVPVNDYLDPDGNPLAFAQWQIATDYQFTSIVFDRQIDGAISMMLPMGVLNPGETYYLRTRHFDSNNTPSPWSDSATLVADTVYPNDADGNYINDDYQVAGNPDTNNNGIPDQDEGICNLYDAQGGNIVGITSDAGDVRCYTSISNSVASNTNLEPDSEVPLGMFSFRVDGLPVDVNNPAAVDVTVYLPEAYSTDSGWQKYDEATGEFSDFSSNVTFSGNTATVRLVDGGAGDQDGTVNGVIVDPSGPVVLAAAPPVTPPVTPPTVPPSSPLPAASGGGGGGALGLIGLLSLTGIAIARRRRPGQQQTI